MKKIIEILGSTIIFWLPILAVAIATKLAQMVTSDMVIGTIKVLALLTIAGLLIIDREEKKLCSSRKRK